MSSALCWAITSGHATFPIGASVYIDFKLNESEKLVDSGNMSTGPNWLNEGNKLPMLKAPFCVRKKKRDILNSRRSLRAEMATST